MQPLTQSDLETIELRQIIYCEKIPNTGIILYILATTKKHIEKYIANTSIDVEVYKKLYMLLNKNTDKGMSKLITGIYLRICMQVWVARFLLTRIIKYP